MCCHGNSFIPNVPPHETFRINKAVSNITATTKLPWKPCKINNSNMLTPLTPSFGAFIKHNAFTCTM